MRGARAALVLGRVMMHQEYEAYRDRLTARPAQVITHEGRTASTVEELDWLVGVCGGLTEGAERETPGGEQKPASEQPRAKKEPSAKKKQAEAEAKAKAEAEQKGAEGQE
jgi:hypothetical protein